MRTALMVVILVLVAALVGCGSPAPITSTNVTFVGDLTVDEISVYRTAFLDWESATGGAFSFTFDDVRSSGAERQLTVISSTDEAEFARRKGQAITNGIGRVSSMTKLSVRARSSLPHLHRVAVHEIGHVLGVIDHLPGDNAMGCTSGDEQQITAADVAAAYATSGAHGPNDAVVTDE